MAIFGKDRERKGTDDHIGPEPREVEMFEREKGRAEMTTETGGANAFLGKGTSITGKLTFDGPVRIEGQVEGEIDAKDTLTIGEGADVRAQTTGTSIIVHGTVSGDIKATKRLEIKAPGKVVGNITAPVLVIHEGVIFEGQCSMGVSPARAEKDGKVTPLPTDKPEAKAEASK